MYIWVILAAFIATLYSFNLHFREDIKDVRHSPIAEAAIAKLIIQQRSALSYFTSNSLKIVSEAPIGGGVDIEEADIRPYAPSIINFPENVITRLYCTDKETGTTGVACNLSENVAGYVISYAPIEYRWLIKTKLDEEPIYIPNLEYLKSIERVMGNTTSLGYSLQTVDGDIKIQNGVYESFVPEYIVATDENFRETCLEDRPCLVYLERVFSK